MALNKVQIAGDEVAAELVPERGGIVSRLTIGGDEVFYLDPATLDTPKVRGGNPILFPNPGPLAGGAFQHASGKEYKLGQHGFARELPWQLVATDGKSAEIRLASDNFTRERFPYDFDVRIIYRCSGSTFTVEQHWNNLSSEPMPLHFGFHPYFTVADADKAGVTVSTDATQAWDNVTKKEGPWSGPLDLTVQEVDLHFVNHTPKETIMTRPGHKTLRISWDDPYKWLVVWTLKGKDFVCVEPWTARANALNSKEGLVHIGPRERRKSFVAITAL